jgi:hypothetical protein
MGEIHLGRVKIIKIWISLRKALFSVEMIAALNQAAFKMIKLR